MSNTLKRIIIILLSIATIGSIVFGFIIQKNRVIDTTVYESKIDEEEEFVYIPEISYIYEEERIVFSDEVENILSSMTLKEKVSQMFIVDIDDITNENITAYTEELDSLLDEYPVGGLIYNIDNLNYFYPTRRLLWDVSDIYEDNNHFPILNVLSNDESFYPLDKIYGQTTLTPKEVVTTYLPEESDDYFLEHSSDISNIGFNATKLSLNVEDDDYSFSSDPIYASEFIEEGLKAYNTNQVFTIGSKFPYKDQKEKAFKELLTSDLIPYQEAIDSNICSIQVSSKPCFAISENKNMPLMMSKRVVDLLRARMGSDGVIISDSFKNVTAYQEMSKEDMMVESIIAGIDTIYDPDDYQNAIDRIIKEVNEGNISLITIENSVGRILTKKLETLY